LTRQSLACGATATTVGIFYLDGEHLVSAKNLVVLLCSVIVWVLLWRVLTISDGGAPAGLVRCYFLYHMAFVQVGLLIIYFASQRPLAEARLLIGFDVSTTVRAVIVPAVGMAAFTAGVVTYRSRGMQRRGPVSAGRQLESGDSRLLLLILVGGLAYTALSMAVRGYVPLLEVLQGGNAEAIRLQTHYGSAPYIFHPSIVHLVPIVLAPFAAMYLWETSAPRTAGRWLAWIVWAVVAGLLANSLERSTMMIVGLWLVILIYYRRQQIPWRLIGVFLAGFVVMTFVLHGGRPDVIRNQIFRRFGIVNAMVNYFAIEHFPGAGGFRSLQTYTSYLTDGVLSGGTTFSKALIGSLFPGQTIGTAPVGALTEAWVNVGWMLILLLFLQGVVYAQIDDRFRGRLHSPLVRVYYAGLVAILSGTAYAGILSIGFSAGVFPMTALYLVIRRPSPARRTAGDPRAVPALVSADP
jgi:hypothetical protein